MCLSIAINRPSHILAEGVHCGFKWIVVHNGQGFRCGYVRVPLGHPWHNKHYDDINADVHGGITFTEADVPCNKDGASDNGWWLGFDCAHYNDKQDVSLPYEHKMSWTNGVVRTQSYVEEECKCLCEQANQATKD